MNYRVWDNIISFCHRTRQITSLLLYAWQIDSEIIRSLFASMRITFPFWTTLALKNCRWMFNWKLNAFSPLSMLLLTTHLNILMGFMMRWEMRLNLKVYCSLIYSLIPRLSACSYSEAVTSSCKSKWRLALDWAKTPAANAVQDFESKCRYDSWKI